MFDFQVFRRAEAKTFPVDRKGIKEKKGKERERKRKAKEARKKLEMNPQKKNCVKAKYCITYNRS